MRFLTFDTAYLPDSANAAHAFPCTVNIDRISLILPLEENVNGAKTGITVDGREVHVPQTPENVVRMLNDASAQ